MSLISSKERTPRWSQVKTCFPRKAGSPRAFKPMDNLDNVLRFLELVNHPLGLNIGMRHISLSTCGVLPGIRRLADMDCMSTVSIQLPSWSSQRYLTVPSA